jgi:hypothetical protein
MHRKEVATVKRAGFVLFVILSILSIECLAVRVGYSEAVKTCEIDDHACIFKAYKSGAERGDVHAQVVTGWMYYYGEGVLQDTSQAVNWYQKAAEQGDVTAMFNLAYAYEHGDGVKRDLNESRRWYGTAAEQKSALERLDLVLLTKTFLIPDVGQERVARFWADQKRLRYERTAEEVKIAQPATVIATSPPEEASTARVVKKVNTSVPSLSAGGRIFEDPRLEGIRQAAEAGDLSAQVALGWIYSSGTGVPVDKVQAIRWYRSAAEKGSLKAQVALGWLYYEGQGVERNLTESALWYNKAAAQGDVKARQMLKKIKALVHKM